MDRIIGAVLGLAAFTAVIALSLSKGISFAGCAVRATVALVLGYLVGRLIFGLPGLSIVKEAAGPIPPPPPPPAPGDSKPVGKAPDEVPPPPMAS
ncbi:MAG TPA: hypothetical protein VE981_02410 [Planctomycetota bacterium]|nr:hypothetical protein [Planctomycetota bacterium]